MTIRTTSRLAAPFAALAALFVPGVAPAQMTPLSDNRQTFAEAKFFGNTISLAEQPAAPFAYFESYLDALAENPDPNGGGSCQAFSFQISQFFPAGISMSGGTSGGWSVHEGQYTAHSLAGFRFHVDTCVEYQLDAWLDYGDFPDPGAGHVQLTGPTVQTLYHDLTTTGEIHTTGRLAPGEYRLEGRSGFAVGGELESVTGPVYSAIWTCVPCATSLVAGQPSDLDVACGATAVFTVTADPGAGPVTYQWRRNLVALANSSHISGADTQALSIDSACHADSGYYDVVLSNGTIIEPSRPARLGITTTTAVEGAPEGPQRTFTILAAGPNPFQRSTSFRYAVGSPRHVRIAIYDIAGERVRTLADGIFAGSGIVTWDGSTDAGAQMPAGIYFLRAESGSSSESRRLVLIK